MFKISPVHCLYAAAIVLVLCLIGWRVHEWGQAKFEAGQADVQAKWDKQKKEDAKAAKKINTVGASISTKIVTQYVDRVKIIREKADAIVQQVPVYVPAGLPLLPGGFRLSLDAAAANDPIPSGAVPADAAPVAPQVAAISITGNYGTANQTAARLIKLQDWAYAQCLNNPPPEGCTAPYD